MAETLHNKDGSSAVECKTLEFVLDEHDKVYDPFEVKGKQADYDYRLVNRNARNVQRRSMEGFERVETGGPEELVGAAPNKPMKAGEPVDTTIGVGDVILMRRKKEIGDRHRKMIRKLTERRTASIDSTSELGSTGFVDKREGTKGGYTGSMDENQFNEAEGAKK